MTFQPTEEQQRIIDAAVSSQDNLLIAALAGAAKTTTLVLVAEATAPARTLCLAFNRKIADEMKLRLPPHCESRTLNALGHRIWCDVIGKRASIDTAKVGNLLTAEIEKMTDFTEKRLAKEAWLDLVRAVAWGKQQGYVPDGFGRGAKPLLTDELFKEYHEERWTPAEFDLIRATTVASLVAAWQGDMDYDDQILMPTVFPAVFPRYPLILVDEAQDLSALNHAMLKKLVVKRLIAVGDECQAIYGFRGAHEESMSLLEEEFQMRKLILSTSFRCPIDVVKHARWRAPHMQWPEWAKPGLVTAFYDWRLKDIPSEAAILCRNNAPLFSLAIKMISNGRYAELSGNDIGKGLLRIMQKFGPPSTPRADVLKAIDAWQIAKEKKSKDSRMVHDRAECMRIFAAQGKDLGESIAYANHLFSASSPVKLMTVHKSKGLEFEHVFILDQHLMGNEGQELNLKYVAQTRTKDTLTYIDLDSLDLSPEWYMALPNLGMYGAV